LETKKAAGDGGNGKSTAILSIISDITNGKALPCGSNGTPVDIILQSAEDRLEDTIKPRAEQFGADSLRIHTIDDEEHPLTLDDDRIEAAIVEKNAKLCVFDPLQAYIGDADMNRASAMRPLMKHLTAVADRTGCAIVIIGHLNRSGKKAIYRGLGSSDIFNAARSVLTVGKIGGEKDISVMAHTKCNLAPLGVSLAFGLDSDGKFSWCGEYAITSDELLSGQNSQSENQSARAERLLREILVKGPLPAKDMEKMVAEWEVSAKTIQRAKERIGIKSIKSGSVWLWSLPTEHELSDDQDSQTVADYHDILDLLEP
jgi:hypothetical protein